MSLAKTVIWTVPLGGEIARQPEAQRSRGQRPVQSWTKRGLGLYQTTNKDYVIMT